MYINTLDKGENEMNNSRSDSYKAAGVDITAGYRAVELMKQHIARTITKGASSDIGGFGGLFELDLTGIASRKHYIADSECSVLNEDCSKITTTFIQ